MPVAVRAVREVRVVLAELAVVARKGGGEVMAKIARAIRAAPAMADEVGPVAAVVKAAKEGWAARVERAVGVTTSHLVTRPTLPVPLFST